MTVCYIHLPAEMILTHTLDITMWRRKKTTIKEEKTVSQQAETKETDLCPNCIRLMQENSQLKEQIAVLSGEGRRKQYTIAPTLYTFYKNNVQKNRITR